MDKNKEFQNLLDGTVSEEETNLFKQELASGERRERRLRWTVIVSIVAAMIFLVFGGFWWGKTREITMQSATAQAVIQEGMQAGLNEAVREQLIAEMQNTELQKQAQIILARQLSAQAQLLFATNDSKRMTAVQLAIESMRLFPSAEAAQIMADNKLAYPVSQMVNAVNFVAFSPNGQYVVSVGAHEDTVRVWEVETGKEIARVVHQYGVWSAAVSPDGKYVVSGGGDGTARVWEIDTGKEISRMVHGDVVWTVAFSPNGKYVISRGGENAIRIWETETGKEIDPTTLEDGGMPFAILGPNGKYAISNASDVLGKYLDKDFIRIPYDKSIAAISPDGKYAISWGCDKQEESGACSKGFVLVRDVKTGKEITRMVHEGSVYAASFSPDGRYIVSGSLDYTARVWDAFTGKEISRMTHDGYVYSVAFSPDGKYVVSRSADGTVRVWDSTTGEDVARMIHPGSNSVAFSPDGKYIVSSAGLDNTGRVWKIDNRSEVARMEQDEGISSLAISPDGRYIASASDKDTTLQVWEVETGKEVFHKAHGNPVSSIAFSPDGSYFVTGGYDYTVRVWETGSGHRIAFMKHDDFVYSVAFSPDGKYVVSGSDDHTARVWDAMTGEEIARRTFDVDISPVSAFSPDGNYVVSGGCDKQENDLCLQGSARVWEISTGEEISRMTHDYKVSTVAFSPDGKYVVSGGDITARVWEADTGKEIARMTHESGVNSAVFSPDGKFVASTGGGSAGYVWEALTGREIFHMINVSSAKFSPDGRFVIAIDWNANIVRVWDLDTEQEVIQMKYDGYVHSVDFSPDGKYAISSGGNTIRVWLYRPEDLIAKTCSRVTRNLTLEEWQQYIGDVLPYQEVCPVLPNEQQSTPGPTPIPPSSATATPTPVPVDISSSASATPVVTASPLPDEITDEKNIHMRLIPEGEFIMGSSAEDINLECAKDSLEGACAEAEFLAEQPAHRVFLDTYYMDKYEVSNAAYRACVNAGACDSPFDKSSSTRSSYYGVSAFDNYPVIYVDWDLAKTYCEWRGARLPTEAEWEKAARGEDGQFYPWGNSFEGGEANFCGSDCPINWLDWSFKNYNDGYADTAPVNSFPLGISPYGIYNMAGNVLEWVNDWYNGVYYSDSPALNPIGPASGRARILRGGSWFSPSYTNAHSSRRTGREPWASNHLIGFRCAQSVVSP